MNLEGVHNRPITLLKHKHNASTRTMGSNSIRGQASRDTDSKVATGAQEGLRTHSQEHRAWEGSSILQRRKSVLEERPQPITRALSSWKRPLGKRLDWPWDACCPSEKACVRGRLFAVEDSLKRGLGCELLVLSPSTADGMAARPDVGPLGGPPQYPTRLQSLLSFPK